MRMTRLFSQTLRAAPADAEAASQQLLVRAGYIRQLAAGIYSYLPLARRALTRIENILRDEMNAIGGQEITMPVVQPADIWKETGRWFTIGTELGRFKDKAGRDMVLAMTHEEVVADLVRKELHSYRQLPQLIYHIQTKWRDDPRPRAGLIRVREFTMKDSYSLDAGWDGLDTQYRAHYQAYFNIFNRCGLPTIAVQSDVGMMGGSMAHEFMYLTPLGEDTLVLCDHCGYAANRQIARFGKPAPSVEPAQPLRKVATPTTTTIDALARLLEIPTSETAKAVFMVATITGDNGEDAHRFVFAVVRGDMEVNETKLANVVAAKALRPATEDEIRAIGAEPGYGSPVGVRDAFVVVDELVARSSNLVAGANEAGYHLLNVNYGRDYTADVVADITAARAGDPCPNCGHALHTSGGVEVGNIFKLGTRYTDALGATFLDRDGKQQPVIMGSYGIGVGRLLACIAEHHHDERGLIWPVSVAPYQVHLVALLAGGAPVQTTADDLYMRLATAGVDVLYDDRDESPGVKFMDADLSGLPLRLTVGKQSLAKGGVELKPRHAGESRIVPVEEVVSSVQQMLQALEADLARNIGSVPFDA